MLDIHLKHEINLSRKTKNYKTMKTTIYELKNLITEKMSKAILIATLIGTTCFQSCTKENTVKPLGASTSKNNKDHFSMNNIPNSIKNSNVPIEKDETIVIIKCGTEIPNSPIVKFPRRTSKVPSKPGEPTPPIYIPEQAETK